MGISNKVYGAVAAAGISAAAAPAHADIVQFSGYWQNAVPGTTITAGQTGSGSFDLDVLSPDMNPGNPNFYLSSNALTDFSFTSGASHVTAGPGAETIVFNNVGQDQFLNQFLASDFTSVGGFGSLSLNSLEMRLIDPTTLALTNDSLTGVLASLHEFSSRTLEFNFVTQSGTFVITDMQVVPSPAGLAVLGAGAVAVAARRRRSDAAVPAATPSPEA